MYILRKVDLSNNWWTHPMHTALIMVVTSWNVCPACTYYMIFAISSLEGTLRSWWHTPTLRAYLHSNENEKQHNRKVHVHIYESNLHRSFAVSFRLFAFLEDLFNSRTLHIAWLKIHSFGELLATKKGERECESQTMPAASDGQVFFSFLAFAEGWCMNFAELFSTIMECIYEEYGRKKTWESRNTEEKNRGRLETI